MTLFENSSPVTISQIEPEDFVAYGFDTNPETKFFEWY